MDYGQLCANQPYHIIIIVSQLRQEVAQYAPSVVNMSRIDDASFLAVNRVSLNNDQWPRLCMVPYRMGGYGEKGVCR